MWLGWHHEYVWEDYSCNWSNRKQGCISKILIWWTNNTHETHLMMGWPLLRSVFAAKTYWWRCKESFTQSLIVLPLGKRRSGLYVWSSYYKTHGNQIKKFNIKSKCSLSSLGSWYSWLTWLPANTVLIYKMKHKDWCRTLDRRLIKPRSNRWPIYNYEIENQNALLIYYYNYLQLF